MRRRPSRLVTASAAVIIAIPLVAGCEAKVYGTPPEAAGTQLTVIAPMGTAAPLPGSPPDESAVTFDGLNARTQQATAEAAKSGADISAVVLDRNTDRVISNGNAHPTPVGARYGLSSTTAPYDGHWWNTTSTTSDLVRYYDMLMQGTGGLPPERAQIIISNLSQSTPSGIDGYPQRFGIPDGLFAEPVAVKQGWMCCWDGSNWMHM